MKGSEKQIKWAEDIKAGAIEALQNMRATRERYDAIDGKRNSNLYNITWEAIEAMESEYLPVLEAIDDAKVLIDNRGRFTSDAIRKHAEEWMRFNK